MERTRIICTAYGRQLTLGLPLVLAAFVACGSPTSPSQAQNQFTWTDGGQSFQATSKGMKASRGGGNIFVAGGNCSAQLGFSLTLSGTITIGTFQIGKGLADVSISYFDGKTQWFADQFFGGSGSLTITRLDQARIAGSFSVELTTDTGQGRKTVQAIFDVDFSDRVVC